MPASCLTVAAWLAIVVLSTTACSASAPATTQPPPTTTSTQASEPTIASEPTASPIPVITATPIASAQRTTSPSPNASTAAPPEQIRILHGLRYSCGAPFPALVLWGRANAEEGTDPAAAALRAFVQDTSDPDARWLPDTGWIELARTDDAAYYIAAGGSFGHVEVSLGRSADGIWTVHGYGDCHPEIVLHDRVNAPWKLDPAQLPTPLSTQLHIRALLQIGCPIGPPPGIVIEPHVRYGAGVVDVILGTPYIETGDVACGERVPFTVALDEPLGQRSVFDASSLPLTQRFP